MLNLKNCRNLLSLSAVGTILLFIVLACSNSSSSVEDFRDVSRKTYELLSESNKESLIEDLYKAAKAGDNTALRKVLNRGVPPDATPSGWWTPMMEAASKGNLVIMESLIEFGADVNHSNDMGFTPLITASVNKQPEAVRLLLRSKANVNQKDKRGNTALENAQISFCDECVDLLTEAGGTSSISPEAYKRIKKKIKKR